MAQMDEASPLPMPSKAPELHIAQKEQELRHINFSENVSISGLQFSPEPIYAEPKSKSAPFPPPPLRTSKV
ncbi:unnamed protein product [Toxocara canis]|uniref:Uncharacterized protein n=1 Tax=Toxocara canis TaxID=6265 RepID=A0A3P7FBZ2_TOXCA|nr:unnamed protein product [Toxocara canis]